MDKQGLLKKIKAGSRLSEERAEDLESQAQVQWGYSKTLWTFAEFLQRHPDGATAWAKYRPFDKLDLVFILPKLETLVMEYRSTVGTQKGPTPLQVAETRPAVTVPEGMFTFGGELPSDFEKARDALIEEMFPWSVVEAALLESVS